MLRGTLSLVTSSASPPRTLRRVIEDLQVGRHFEPAIYYFRAASYNFPTPGHVLEFDRRQFAFGQSVVAGLDVGHRTGRQFPFGQSVRGHDYLLPRSIWPANGSLVREHWRNSLAATVKRFTGGTQIRHFVMAI